jgi:hypothetical protein
VDEQAEIRFFRYLPVKNEHAVSFCLGLALMLFLDLKGAVHGGGTPHGFELFETFVFLQLLFVLILGDPAKDALVFSVFHPFENCLDNLGTLGSIGAAPHTIAPIELT